MNNEEALRQRHGESERGISDLYILGPNHEVLSVSSIEEWIAAIPHSTEQFDKMRRIAMTDEGGVKISTVFLGSDYGAAERGHLQVFETAIFWPSKTEIFARYASWAEAEAGHAEAIRFVTGDD